MNVLLRRLFRNACRSAWAIALAGALHAAPSAVAQQQPQPKVVVKGLETNRVAANGDCQCRYELTLPAEGYTKLKKAAPDTALLLRKLGMTNQESVVEGLRGDWSDDTNTLKVEFNNRGAARMGKDFTWGLPLMEGVETRLVSFRDGTANLTQEMAIPGVGIATSNIRLTLPKGASDVKISRDQTRLTYKLPEPTDAGTTVSADFDVDAKKHVMASLAKVHSNRKFANLWTARSVFKNTGDAVLKDYRVRFRMTEYTPTWSPWTGTPLVVPGQTVVDAYFPVMDLDKVGKLTGQTKTSIEIQWQYTRPDGKRFEDTDTKEITLLSRNQVQYSSMKLEECSDWNDAFDMSPIVMGCFVTHEDPVIQQVAGRICKAIGGNEGYLSDEGALQFMAAAFDFMGANIAYQTSPGSVNDHKLLQHVKYGRDVLRNKAGTCIDLAILYGSLCEAVGLKPVLFNIPGHCFPGVYLPKSGKLITVEATQIGKASFIDAVNYAHRAEHEADPKRQEPRDRRRHHQTAPSRRPPDRPPGARRRRSRKMGNHLRPQRHAVEEGERRARCQSQPDHRGLEDDLHPGLLHGSASVGGGCERLHRRGGQIQQRQPSGHQRDLDHERGQTDGQTHRRLGARRDNRNDQQEHLHPHRW